jgi:hypothetical protein
VGAGWVLFRCRSFEQLLGLLSGLANFTLPVWWATYAQTLFVLAMPLVLMQAWQARRREAETFHAFPRGLRVWVQAFLLLAVVAWWRREPAEFIYFQF